jgi:DNA-3-methyladenine glycosylase I
VSAVGKGIVVGADGVARCAWATGADDYTRYHDVEWGFPVTDDRRLFEKLCLEGFQSGLSWLTILRKRDGFRRAFADFDVHVVARYGSRDVERLLADASIVRHRGKIEAAIANAQRCCELVEEEGSLARYVWSFEPDPRERPTRVTWEVLRETTQTDASRALASDLKRRGWRYVGPTTVYAFMQAMGLVNDHLALCDVASRVDAARSAFARPGPSAADELESSS